MTSERCPEGISCEDQRIIRLFKITISEFPHALYLVFKWGCKKVPTESLEEYLTKKKGMSNKDYREKFNSLMRQTIKDDPSGKTYDVSLLWASIKWGCDDLAQGQWQEGDQGLESLCTTVKNYRNRLFHKGVRMCDDTAMNRWCMDATNVLEKLVKSAGYKYSIPDHDIKKEIEDIKEQIDKIMNATLGHLDPVMLHRQMLKLRAEQMNIINAQGKTELSEKYRHISKIDPAAFVTGKERLHVDNVFTKLEVICENKGKSSDKAYDVQYNKLLRVKTKEGKEPVIIIVEGDAGAGKTTLSKHILSDWADRKSIFKGLKDYDLVLYGEGRNKHISSYLELIQALMPTASYQLADDDLVRSVLQLKVLLVMDGFDELNSESRKLIRELLDKQIPGSSGKLQLLITTRPSKLSDLHNIVKPHTVVQTKLVGISVNKRVEFVSKLHDEMIKEGQSIQETQKLIALMKKSQSRLGEHYRLPLNLTLLTYLWASDPNKVNLETTATGLYIAFMELLQSRLLVRLQDHVDVDKCEEVIREFLQEMYRVCLDTLSLGSMQLSDLSTKALKEKCEKLKLPFNEMVEAFLTVEKEWMCSGYKTFLTVPHKSIMEFYAASGFMMYINMNDASSLETDVISLLEKRNVPEERMEEELQKILSILNKYPKPEDGKCLKEICHKHLSTDLTLYQNMFLYVTGLLAHHSQDMLQEYAEELVEILRNAGHNGTELLNVLVEAKCDEKLAGALTLILSEFLDIRAGHMGAALVLFKQLKTNTTVRVYIEHEVSHIPHLDDVLCQLSKKDCDVSINFMHQWIHPECGFSDDHLYYLLHREDEDHQCRLIHFTGHLKTFSHLPKSLKYLQITFSTTAHAQQLLKELPDLAKNCSLLSFAINVMPDVQPDGLSPLPVMFPERKECGSLLLSKVAEGWKVTCRVIRALQPLHGKFSNLRFIQDNFSANWGKDLILELGKLKVKADFLSLSSSIINKNELNQLDKLSRKIMGCNFICNNDTAVWEYQ